MKQKILIISYKILLLLLIILLGLTLVSLVQYLTQSLKINKIVLKIWLIGHWELLSLLATVGVIVISLGLYKRYSIKNLALIKSIVIFQKWTIHDLMLGSMFTSLILVTEYLTLFLPRLPLGGSLELKYLFLLLVTYLMTLQKGLIISIISTLVSLIMIPKIVINIWQYWLDYFIPALAPVLIGLIRFDFKKPTLVKIKILLITTAVFGIIYVSQVISGHLYFHSYAWNGFSSWTYALIYNFISVVLVTYPITVLVLLLIFKKNKSIRKGISC